jgi:hypothetical protein
MDAGLMKKRSGCRVHASGAGFGVSYASRIVFSVKGVGAGVQGMGCRV